METAQELLNRVLVENRRGSSDSDKPESSKVLVIVKLVLLLER
jgi:hypothetical protein